MKIYTKKGDDGTTGLLYGGRVLKNSFRVELNGTVDEAQAALGLARAIGVQNKALQEILISIERDLWVLMAEVATLPKARAKLVPEASLVTIAMVERLEARIDSVSALFEMPTAFVVPGSNLLSASLDVARTVIRRAERGCVDFLSDVPETIVGQYLNRLSDLIWTLARWVEDEHLLARTF